MPGKITLVAGRQKSLLRRHPWIFTGAIKSNSGKLHSGDTVDIYASDGSWLACGAWSPSSQIRVRVWTFDPDEVIDNAFFQRRIARAAELRSHLSELKETDAMRLVASESDGLPGIIIDRYGKILVCQLLSAGAEKHRSKILWALDKLFPECQVMERSDAQVRKKEGLEPLVETYAEDMPTRVNISENGLTFTVDLLKGHKTGFYLDQRSNRQYLSQYVDGKTVLNCFSYTGAIGVYCLKAGASHVTQIDMSADALALAAENLELNDCSDSDVELVKADVFKQLRAYRTEGRHFDVIVLDPPKFVDSRHHLTKACRGYKDINLLAMQLLNPNGILVTFSCSGLMPEDLFRKVVADAALDAKRDVQYVQRLNQDADHPVSSAFPEGHYLKGMICRVI